jgi:translation initiation factor 2 gamma subunit (eIF-2gamma)
MLRPTKVRSVKIRAINNATSLSSNQLLTLVRPLTTNAHQSNSLSINYQKLRKIVGTNIFANVRTMAEYIRAKPHVNIGTIGHVDHGDETFLL